MITKISRAALVAGIGTAAVGVSAIQAEAASANALSTPTYYVKSPTIESVGTITPESAVVAGVIDTGGDPVSYLPVPSGGLVWDGDVTIAAGGPVAGAPASAVPVVPVDGIPVSGSNDPVSVTVTDGSTTKTLMVANNGADNFSTVTFAYDPASDYEASGGQPGPATQYASGINVPTTTGLSTVKTTLGAFGQTAQANSGNKPLKPGTKYYFWLLQQPGGTDAATSVNLAGWAKLPANPTGVCLPNAAIQQDAAVNGLASSTSATAVNADGVTAAGNEGDCNYYYGDTAGGNGLQSPSGEFTTPALGKLAFARSAKVNGRSAILAVTNSSGFKAGGSVELDDGQGNALATGKFTVAARKTGSVKLALTKAGAAAAAKHTAAELSLTSDWDQKTGTRKVMLASAAVAKKK